MNDIDFGTRSLTFLRKALRMRPTQLGTTYLTVRTYICSLSEILLTHQAVAGKNIKISKDEIMKAGENMTNIVQLEDGNYLGVLGVYHQLHCLVSQAAFEAELQLYAENLRPLIPKSEHYPPRFIPRLLQVQDE